MTPQERLKKIRKFLGLSQTAFGAKIGKSYRTIQQYEDGTIKPEKIVWDLLYNFNIDPYWFMLGKGEMLLSGDSDTFSAIKKTLLQEVEKMSDGEVLGVLSYIDLMNKRKAELEPPRSKPA